MTPGPGQDPGSAAADTPPNPARAETYLRLLAEAELRRVLTLPREEWPGSVLPGPARCAARAAQRLAPLGRQAADAMQPLADGAARTLPPLARRAEQAAAPLAEDILRTVQPLADEARRALQPLAENAARTLQPLAARLVQTALPLADEAARRLHPRAWQAAARVRSLRYTSTPGDGPGWHEQSAEQGLHRVRAVARALTQAGAIDDGTAESVLAGLETALVARSRIGAHWLFMRDLRLGHRGQLASAPAGQYLAVPIGVTVPASPDSGETGTRLFALVIGPDKAAVTVGGRLPEPAGARPYPGSWAFQRPGKPGATDDRGNTYQLGHDVSWSASDGNWSGVLSISPVPPPGLRWLELSLSPGSPPVRVGLTGNGAGGNGAAEAAGPGSAAERLVDAAAESLLRAAVVEGESALWPDLTGAADVVTALDAVGMLAPARAAVGRLVALAGRVGTRIPPALTTVAQPAQLPEAWEILLANSGREDGPRAVAAAAAVLPELDGTRFVLAGLRSGPTGAGLQTLAWGSRAALPHRFHDEAAGHWSWSVRDDKGRWHIATEGGVNSGDRHATLELQLAPALHPDATSVEVTLACPAGQVSATVPLTWWETT